MTELVAQAGLETPKFPSDSETEDRGEAAEVDDSEDEEDEEDEDGLDYGVVFAGGGARDVEAADW